MWSRRAWSRAAGVALCVPASRVWAKSAVKGGQGLLQLQLDAPSLGRNELGYLDVQLRLSSRPNELGDPQIEGDPSLRTRLQTRSSSQMTRIVNGQYSVEYRYNYRFEVSCAKAGQFALGAKVQVDGKWIVATSKAQLQVRAQGAKRPVTQAGDPVMVVPHLSPEGPLYVGQMALFHLELWSRSSDSPTSVERPKFRDFITEDFPAPRQRVVHFKGNNYEVQSVYYRAVFPQKAGILSIDGLSLEMRPSGLGSLFGRRRPRRPYRVQGPDTQVEVKALPTRGQPANFPSANVGSFAIRSEVDRHDISQGDAFTLTVEISGHGNLRLVEPQALGTIAGLRGYEPKREEPNYEIRGNKVDGVVRWRYLLIAEKSGTVQIPALALAYFDPDKERYFEQKSSPITLDVKAKAGAAPAPAADTGPDVFAESPEPQDALEQSAEHLEFAAIAPGEGLDDRRERRHPWLSLRRYLGLCALAPAAVGLSWGQRRISALVGEPERARKRAEKAELLALLKGAQEPSAQGGKAAAWSSLGQLLQRLALRYAGSQAQGLPRPELIKAMKERGLSEKDAQAWRDWMDQCDASRFGAAASQGDEELKKACAFAQAQIELAMQQGERA